MINKFFDWSDKWIVQPMGALLIITLGAFMFIGIPYGIYSMVTYKPPETFELRVDSWECTASHITKFESCGAKTGCSWHTEKVCDRWDRK